MLNTIRFKIASETKCELISLLVTVLAPKNQILATSWDPFFASLGCLLVPFWLPWAPFWRQGGNPRLGLYILRPLGLGLEAFRP